MCQFIESIRIENGTAQALELHHERMNRTRRHFWKDCRDLNLEERLTGLPEQGIYKCRVVYDEDIRQIEIRPYSIRPVRTLQMVRDDQIDYTFKKTDRTAIDRLFAQRKEADDILIVRNGYLTDTSIGNIALYDGHTWITPEQPLLKGVRREILLRNGKIRTAKIRWEDMTQYDHLRIFNAMIDFGDIEIPIRQIHE